MRWMKMILLHIIVIIVGHDQQIAMMISCGNCRFEFPSVARRRNIPKETTGKQIIFDILQAFLAARWSTQPTLAILHGADCTSVVVVCFTSSRDIGERKKKCLAINQEIISWLRSTLSKRELSLRICKTPLHFTNKTGIRNLKIIISIYAIGHIEINLACLLCGELHIAVQLAACLSSFYYR